MHTGRDDSQPEPPAYSAAEPAWFEIAVRRETLTLSGSTVSDDHEQQLRDAAAGHFPDKQLQTNFRSPGVAPDWWARATTGLVAVLPAIESPTARLQTDALRISGVAGNRSVAELQLQTLENMLPDSLALHIRLVSVAEHTTVQAACADQFTRLEPGPVKFEESGLEFRPSAYPVLDRIVALADACRDSTIAITGHSDSSGNESWNQQLSLERARAVASYLDDRGIESTRIVVAGAGSSVPVASNTTRFGRSLNRRIEISMTPGRPE